MFREKIGKVTFTTAKKLDTADAKDYAIQQLQKGNYKNCTIGNVIVNEMLVMRNVKIS